MRPSGTPVPRYITRFTMCPPCVRGGRACLIRAAVPSPGRPVMSGSAVTESTSRRSPGFRHPSVFIARVIIYCFLTALACVPASNNDPSYWKRVQRRHPTPCYSIYSYSWRRTDSAPPPPVVFLSLPKPIGLAFSSFCALPCKEERSAWPRSLDWGGGDEFRHSNPPTPKVVSP